MTWLVIAAAPVVVLVVVVFLREPLRWALPAFAVFVPFGSALSVASSPFASASSLTGALLGAGLVLQLTLTQRRVRTISPSVGIWLLFLALAAAASLWSIDRAASVKGLIGLASLVLIFVFVALSHVDRDIVRRTENGVLIGGVAVVGYGLYQLLFLGGFPDDTGAAGVVEDGRFGNDLLGPGVQALSLLLPMLIALNRAFGDRGMWARLLYAAVAAEMLWGVLMTGSRAGTLAVAASLLVLALFGPRQARAGLLACTFLGILVATLVWVYQPAGVATRTFETATSSSGRLEIWRVGMAACDQYCLSGAGWGAFPEVYSDTQAYVPAARVLVGSEGSYEAHNLWLLALIELGVLGLVLLVWGLAQSVLEAQRLPAALRGPQLGALAGLLVAVFFLSSMEYKFFWMILIMGVLYRNQAAGESVPRVAHDRAVV